MNAAHTAYIRRETAISIAINATLSVAFFLLVFRLGAPVVVRGPGNYAFDFLPQSVAIGFMATLVPGAITATRLRKGQVAPSQAPSRLPGSLIVRSLMLASAAALPGLAVAGLLTAMAPDTPIAPLPALFAKMLYGGALGAIVTPIGLRRALYVQPTGDRR